MKIVKIFKEHACCPIRWFAELDDGKIITIRERFNKCIVYKESKSIFSVVKDDVILEFQVDDETSGSDEVLKIAIEKMEAQLSPYAYDFLDESWDEYEKTLEK
jgi:hypothetical protein